MALLRLYERNEDQSVSTGEPSNNMRTNSACTVDGSESDARLAEGKSHKCDA